LSSLNTKSRGLGLLPFHRSIEAFINGTEDGALGNGSSQRDTLTFILLPGISGCDSGFSSSLHEEPAINSNHFIRHVSSLHHPHNRFRYLNRIT
jgi:hypothetical protein